MVSPQQADCLLCLSLIGMAANSEHRYEKWAKGQLIAANSSSIANFQMHYLLMRYRLVLNCLLMEINPVGRFQSQNYPATFFECVMEPMPELPRQKNYHPCTAPAQADRSRDQTY